MKTKKIIAGVFASALLISSTFSVLATSITEKGEIEWNMTKSYSKTTNNGVGYMYYHAGSQAWYDDLSAYSETKISSGMSGYAYVYVKSMDGKTGYKESTHKIDNSYIRSGRLDFSGEDYAKRVEFRGFRFENGSDNDVGYNYILK